MEAQKTHWFYKVISILSFLSALISTFFVREFYIFSDFSGSLIEWMTILAPVLFVALGFATWIGKKLALIIAIILILGLFLFIAAGLILGLGMQGAMSFI